MSNLLLNERQVMRAREFSSSQRRVVEKVIPSIFPGHSWPGAVVGSQTAAMDEGWLDGRALLRWADDGGWWLGDGNSTVSEVRT